jgi:GxxExxY protein
MPCLHTHDITDLPRRREGKNRQDTKEPILNTRERIERIATVVVDASVQVHRELGAGLLESVYQSCFAQELRDRGLRVDCEVVFPVRYSSLVIPAAFRVDMIVEEQVIVENKAVQTLLPVHEAQILTYLKLSGRSLGFLINWNVPRIREGIKRMAHNL